MKKTFTITLPVLFILTMIMSCKKDSKGESINSETSSYGSYYAQVESNVSKLSEERKSQREKWLNELYSNLTYLQLVKNKVVSVEYLPVLTAISDAIKNSVIENGKPMFSISEEIVQNVENSADGMNKMSFVVNVSSLSLTMNGGLPTEVVEIFDRYKEKYGYFSEGDKVIFNTAGKNEKLEKGFNITSAFALIDPKNEKVLDAIYESNFTEVGNWSEAEDVEYINSFMTEKQAYIKYLKLNYSDSKYLPKMKDYKHWDEYDPIVKGRIEIMIFSRDCDGLQNEFNAATEVLEAIHANGRTSERNSELITFLNNQMENSGCY